MKNLRKIVINLVLFFVVIAIVIVTLAFFANRKINFETQNLTSSQLDQLPNYSTGLLLGTSKKLKDGRGNLYFQYRIKAAVELYNSGRIKNLIVSGDNSVANYNEPLTMKNSLIENGIPEGNIYLDYAGFRTLDSVIRAKKIFGQNEIIIISQKFHNQRAVFIANQNDIKAFGFNAKDISARAGRKTMIREYFARLKTFIDIILNKQPKFLGEKVIID